MAKSLAAAAALLALRSAGGANANCQKGSDCPEEGQFCHEEADMCISAPGGTAPNADSFGFFICQPGTVAPLAHSNTECVACALGKYQNEAAKSSCKDIPAGNRAPGATALEECPVGTFNDKDANPLPDWHCQACEAGKFASSPGSTECRCAAPGSAPNTQASDQEPCPPGKKSAGCAACEACEPGKISKSSGAESCEDVQAGHEPNGARSAQIACKPGFFQDKPGMEDCEPCPDGTFSTEYGATKCEKAPAGYIPDDGKDKVVPCVPGYYSEEGQSFCQSCPIGKFSSESGSSACQCAPDGSQPNAGSTGTQVCPAGTKSAAMAGTECKLCTNCLPGKFSPDSGATDTCKCAFPGHKPDGSSTGQEKCSKGTFSGGCEQDCQACPAGKFADEEGLSECKDVPAGSISLIGHTTYKCGKGSYSNDPSLGMCKKCDKGKYSETEGSTECTPCPSGTYGDTFGAEVCSPAPMGHFATEGARAATPCPLGYHQTVSGQSVCVPCDPGKFTNVSASVDCLDVPAGHKGIALPNISDGPADFVRCGAGTYNPQAGNPKQCELCPSGRFSAAPGATACTPTSPGYFANATRQGETPCPIGSFQCCAGGKECIACEVGQTTTEQGQTACEGNGAFGAVSDVTPSVGTASASDDAAAKPCDDKSRTTCCAGKYWSKLMGECLLCAPGHYSTASDTKCQQCEPGFVQAAQGQTQCNSCAGKGFPDVTHTQCTACPPFTASPEDGTGECASCFSSASVLFGNGSCIIQLLIVVFGTILLVGAGYWLATNFTKIMMKEDDDSPHTGNSSMQRQPLAGGP